MITLLCGDALNSTDWMDRFTLELFSLTTQSDIGWRSILLDGDAW